MKKIILIGLIVIIQTYAGLPKTRQKNNSHIIQKSGYTRIRNVIKKDAQKYKPRKVYSYIFTY